MREVATPVPVRPTEVDALRVRWPSLNVALYPFGERLTGWFAGFGGVAADADRCSCVGGASASCRPRSHSRDVGPGPRHWRPPARLLHGVHRRVLLRPCPDQPERGMARGDPALHLLAPHPSDKCLRVRVMLTGNPRQYLCLDVLPHDEEPDVLVDS